MSNCSIEGSPNTISSFLQIDLEATNFTNIEFYDCGNLTLGSNSQIEYSQFFGPLYGGLYCYNTFINDCTMNLVEVMASFNRLGFVNSTLKSLNSVVNISQSFLFDPNFGLQNTTLFINDSVIFNDGRTDFEMDEGTLYAQSTSVCPFGNIRIDCSGGKSTRFELLLLTP